MIARVRPAAPLLFIVLLLLLVASCKPRPRRWSSASARGSESTHQHAGQGGSGEIAEIDLRSGLPEVESRSLLRPPSHHTLFDLLRLIDELNDDDDVRGVFVRFGSAPLGWSHAQELGELLGRVRTAKRVVCHADGLSHATLWAAARGCDRIWLSPAGSIDSVGVATQLVFLHDLLVNRLGVGVDILQVGKFKGAAESLTRDKASAELRESLSGALGAIRGAWLDGLAAARGPRTKELAEDGPFSPEAAKSQGLVDEIGYVDDARHDAETRGGGARTTIRFGGHDSESSDELAALARLLSTGSAAPTDVPHVAVLRAVGAIGVDSRGGPFGESAGITEHNMARLIKRLDANASVHAVVLRIDSPGGSALASDLIWHELMALRAKKPIVVSIADMAASGGYYLASTGKRIVAEPTSIVGSIGVVGGKLSFDHTLAKIGVGVETITPQAGAAAEARAGYESALTGWDDATRKRVQEGMNAVYDLFLRRVAEGRGLPIEEIARSAEGRIFAGQQALDRHLVDEFGGLSRAIAVAKDLAGLPADSPTRVVEESSGLLDWLNLDEDTAGAARESSGSADSSGFGGPWGPAAAAAALLPAELRTFAASLAPLLHDEPATALPVALLLR